MRKRTQKRTLCEIYWPNILREFVWPEKSVWVLLARPVYGSPGNVGIFFRLV